MGSNVSTAESNSLFPLHFDIHQQPRGDVLCGKVKCGKPWKQVKQHDAANEATQMKMALLKKTILSSTGRRL
eukprot:scaffold27109_cov143-Skeletonema_marinoi.AAC.1